MNSGIMSAMRKLGLTGAVSTLEVRLQEASANRLGHCEFLELLLRDEINIRSDRGVARRIKAACFPAAAKTLDDFNWEFNASINRRQMFDLAACGFVRKARNVLFIGPPGVGKSHLAQAIGLQAIRMGMAAYYRSVFDLARDFRMEEESCFEDRTLKRYLSCDLLIVDDMGIRQLPERAGEYLFEVIMRRHEKKATIMTSNRPLSEWGKLIGDVPTAGAILDRFLQNAETVNIIGTSYRLKDKAKER
jgi:DNA replication protein DnaC